MQAPGFDILNDLKDWVRSTWPQVTFSPHWDRRVEEAPTIVLSKIAVPREQQKQGVGTAIMQALVKFADEQRVRLALSPEADRELGTTSRARLVRFYKRFGFVENKGRNKDYRLSEAMYRPPARRAQTTQGVDYEELRRSLEHPPARRLLFRDPRDGECVRRIGPDPSWTPTWRSVPERFESMDLNIAAECARLAIETARAILGDDPLLEQEPAHRRRLNANQALYRADESWLAASNLICRPKRVAEALRLGRADRAWETYYAPMDPAVGDRIRRMAAVAAVLAAADAVAIDRGHSPWEEQASFVPRVDTGSFLDIVVRPDRHLELLYEPERHEVGEGVGAFQLDELLEGWTGLGWGVGTLDQLRVMSGAPYITEDYTVEDDGRIRVGPMWTYGRYAFEDPVEEMAAHGSSGLWEPYYEPSYHQQDDRYRGFVAGTTDAHVHFFDLWWRLCRCRIPRRDLNLPADTTQGPRSGTLETTTVGSLTVRQGTPYEATVVGTTPLYIIEVGLEDELTTVNIQGAYLQQGRLAYPDNLILVTGQQITGELSPLDRKVAEIVLGLRELVDLEEEPAVWANPLLAAAAKAVPQLQVQKMRGIRGSGPSFSTVRRRSSRQADHIANAAYEALREHTARDEFDWVRMAVSDQSGYRDLKSEFGPRGEREALGEEAAVQLYEGQLKGFFVEQLAAYPTLRDYVLKAIDRFPNVKPMVPSGLGVEQAAIRLGEQGYDNWQGFRSLMPALGDPNKVAWIGQLDALLRSAPDYPTGVAALDLFDVMHGFARAPVEDVSSGNLSPAVARTYEAAGLGPEFHNVLREIGEIVEQAGTYFAQNPQESRAPYGKWGLPRRQVMNLSKVLGAHLTPQAMSTFESLRITQEEQRRRVELERDKARRRGSLGWPQYDVYWVQPGTLQAAQPIGYKEDPGDFARQTLPLGREEGDFYRAAMEDPEAQEFSMQHVQERPSEKIGRDPEFLIEDATDLEDEDWDTFLRQLGMQPPDDEAAFRRLVQQVIERLRRDADFAGQYIEFRREAMQKAQDEDSWRYEPDTESSEYGQKVNEIADEAAKQAALDAGYVLVTWDRPFRISLDDPAPTMVSLEAAVTPEQVIGLVDEIVAATRVTDENPDGHLIDTDIIEIDHPTVPWFRGTVSKYRYERRYGTLRAATA